MLLLVLLLPRATTATAVLPAVLPAVVPVTEAAIGGLPLALPGPTAEAAPAAWWKDAGAGGSLSLRWQAGRHAVQHGRGPCCCTTLLLLP